jgi:hypothetical protein
MVGLFNEAVVLDSHEYYTLQLRRFPHTNYFYVDSLSLVYPNEIFWERLAERNERHQQNINTINNGTERERAELLYKLMRGAFPDRYDDYRYIPHILPHMTSQDSIIDLWWRGFDFEREIKAYIHIFYTDTLPAVGFADFRNEHCRIEEQRIVSVGTNGTKICFLNKFVFALCNS